MKVIHHSQDLKDKVAVICQELDKQKRTEVEALEVFSSKDIKEIMICYLDFCSPQEQTISAAKKYII